MLPPQQSTLPQFGSTTNLTDKNTVEAEASDRDRLRSLGYDAVLNRPFGFWSASALNLCQMSIVYENLAAISVYPFRGPLLFIIGYPFVILLHLIMLVPFAELASAFPVAGAMATWAWRCARATKFRHERQWGYLVSGIVLSAHLGKVIAFLYTVTIGTSALYVTMTGEVGVDYDLMTGESKHPQTWWNPVFSVAIVSLVAFFTLTRLARTGAFWICAASFNIGLVVVNVVVLAMCFPKTAGKPKDFGFSQRSTWSHSFAYMIFMGLPLRINPIDALAHMAEETENPSKTVPRAMFASTITHFVITYILSIMYIIGVAPVWPGYPGATPMIPLMMALGAPTWVAYFISIYGIISTCTQLMASVIVTSRFIFSLARDFGLPFSNLLVKTYDGEPWVADVVLLGAMYASIAGFFVNGGNYTNLQSAMGFVLVAVAYLLPLGLYCCSSLNLQYERTEFTLRKLSKPCAAISCLYLLLVIIHACFPISPWDNIVLNKLKTDSLNFFPFILIGILVTMLVSWWLYGRRHYIGPIRALTKWSAGVEINPKDFDSPQGRSNAIQSYIESQTGKKSTVKPSMLARIFGKGTFPSSANLPDSTVGGSLPGRVPDPERQQGSTSEERTLVDSVEKRMGGKPVSQSRTKGSAFNTIAEDEEASYEMSPISPMSRHHAYTQQESRLDATQTEHAMLESQLEPTTYPDWTQSHLEPSPRSAHFNAYSAQQESQLEPEYFPTRPRAASPPPPLRPQHAKRGSSGLLPAFPSPRQIPTASSASSARSHSPGSLREEQERKRLSALSRPASQIVPTSYTYQDRQPSPPESPDEPAAMEESQLDPTGNDYDLYHDPRPARSLPIPKRW